MDENEKFFKSMDKKQSNDSGKNVLLSFLSGILGAILVIAVCFGVPSVRSTVVGWFDKEEASANVSKPEEGTSINPTAMSIENYSETSMGVAEKVLPSIVGIQITYNVSSFFGTGTQTATGSGIIISSDGYILTNNHVVSSSSSSSSSFYEVTDDDVNSVKVTLYNDETTYDARVIGKDEQTDLAVIKIDKDGLTAAELGNSDSVKVGEFAMAVGCPLGLNTTVTAGIISAVNREVTTSDGEKYTTLQTDAAINEGNSGGALVNSEGKVIGINTLKLAGTGVEGMGFAIPINLTVDVTSQLIDGGKVVRPVMGVTVKTLTDEQIQKYSLVKGAYITEIEDFSAAEKAGLKPGDVITEIDGTEVKSSQDVSDIVNSHKVGDTIKVKLYRNNDYRECDVVLEEKK